MKKRFKIGHAEPLPTGRILRFARCHANAASASNKRWHIRALYQTNLGVSPSASLTASFDANRVASLMLRRK